MTVVGAAMTATGAAMTATGAAMMVTGAAMMVTGALASRGAAMMAGGAMMEAARGPAGPSVPVPVAVPVPAGPGPSLPGVLHFIQQEWGRFEAERSRWEAERAELQAQVAALQGECRGGQRSRSELLRRLRMLEAALALERAKCHKLRPDGDLPAPERADAATEAAPDGPAEGGAAEWPEGRHLLRQYLRDVGCSGGGSGWRFRQRHSLLAHGAEELESPPAGASGASLLVQRIEEQIQRNAVREPSERAFPAFPAPEDEDSDEDEDTEDAAADGTRPAKKQRRKPGEEEDEDEDADSEDALGEFSFVGARSRDDAPGS